MEDTITKFTDETVQSLIELGRQTAGPQAVQMVDGIPVPFIIAEGKVVALPDLKFNKHAERPERIEASVRVFDPASFGEYYRKFADAGSRVFADEAKRSVVAVLDYHQAQPRWGSHKLTLELRHSEEWVTWAGRNNKQMSQQEFSEFLEQNSLDIIDPNPASIVEIARDLQGTTEVEFGSGLRMQDGQVRFKYTETTKTSVGASAITVPDSFTLTIPVFIGANPGRIKALLRHRCKEGKLTFWFTLIRPEQHIRDAFTEARAAIASELEIVILNGSAWGGV